MTPSEPNDERLVTITITGNLGSDGGTQAQQPQIQFQGRQFAYLYTTDGGQFDPPVTHLLLPGDPDQLGNVTYANAGDNVTITARDITLPATFYVALSYADRAQVIQAVLNDIVIEAGGGGADAPRAGNFELTVDAE